MVDLGTSQITADMAKHLFLYGLQPHIRKEVFIHHPSTFQDVLLLAERADQAYMADRNSMLAGNTQQFCSGNQGNVSGGCGGHQGNGRGGYQRNGHGGTGNGGGRGQQVNWQNVSQFGNVGYKGQHQWCQGMSPELLVTIVASRDISSAIASSARMIWRLVGQLPEAEKMGAMVVEALVEELRG